MEKLNSDLFNKFENDKIDQMNNILGGSREEPVETPPGELNGTCYSRDVVWENGTVYYPCD